VRSVEVERELARRVQVGVAVHRAVAREHRVPECRERAEHALLIGDAHLRLESDQVVEHGRAILVAKLHHCVGTGGRCADPRVPTGFIGPMRERVAPAPRHLLDRQAAFEVERLLEGMQRQRLGGEQRIDEASYCARSSARFQ
jgi:hypothetical protein